MLREVADSPLVLIWTHRVYCCRWGARRKDVPRVQAIFCEKSDLAARLVGAQAEGGDQPPDGDARRSRAPRGLGAGRGLKPRPLPASSETGRADWLLRNGPRRTPSPRQPRRRLGRGAPARRRLSAMLPRRAKWASRACAGEYFFACRSLFLANSYSPSWGCGASAGTGRGPARSPPEGLVQWGLRAAGFTVMCDWSAAGVAGADWSRGPSRWSKSLPSAAHPGATGVLGGRCARRGMT